MEHFNTHFSPKPKLSLKSINVESQNNNWHGIKKNVGMQGLGLGFRVCDSCVLGFRVLSLVRYITHTHKQY